MTDDNETKGRLERLSRMSNVEIDNIQHIIFINSLQVISSTRHIFSKNDDFSLAEDMIKEDFELTYVDKSRVIIS
jgi:hypothetical protein